MERLGSHVGSVGPGDRACLRVDADLAKLSRVLQGREHASELDDFGDIDVSLHAVLEAQVERITSSGCYLDDVS